MTYNRIYKMLDHERMRWASMNYKRLLTRLSKITKEEKLHCFLILATEVGNQKLFNAGIFRASEVGANISMSLVKSIANETKVFKISNNKIMKDKYKEKITTEKLIKNAPKFVAPEEQNYKKSEDRYLNMFTRDELTRCIDF